MVIAAVWFTYFLYVFQEVSFWQIYGSNFVHVKLVCVRKIFREQVFARFAVFSFHFLFKITISKMVTYVLGCFFITTCS